MTAPNPEDFEGYLQARGWTPMQGAWFLAGTRYSFEQALESQFREDMAMFVAILVHVRARDPLGASILGVAMLKLAGEGLRDVLMESPKLAEQFIEGLLGAAKTSSDIRMLARGFKKFLDEASEESKEPAAS